ncbi:MULTISPECIES: Scr1 family TA system antitoxin-like transcriptional regulator [unclassified Streptomyces]|uniref:helix-turn-helix domain-containing protein n=1 Tax=unclassified Streptomyces TaxID=2593676 RepID=UPI002E2D600A|nr:Scr1 family TA system antitoxin-like transcriptional regulator [Streptomyces sp. NBC_01423]WSX92648.1 Scr1 family TA system antitoxin-like transcriptional regulator [Streptomyces sp. NBC_00891]WSY07125.1 Scr1 family TA system antitoxin-like transcriptional regulator [Streptomyces sp. NBC_00890]WSZ08752.1 Scr1 family TA system antitoxin-like transcriptional regulator [Streptomyces sp. NBC_00869]WSZ23750.1 Scr1 family TA system antitoxin-like transcriptional regulator [Streptomyces sp. NBC_008
MNRKELEPDSSPQAAFGARVRSMREAKGWMQEGLAERTGYSSTHISAVETGRKMPTLRFSRSADRAFGIEETVDTFERQWREIRHGSLLEGFPQYVGYEGRAVELRLYEIGIIPGLLQTPEYARALADSAVQRGAIAQEQADERVSFLAERQAALVRPKPPMLFVIMDESCIRRPVGGADVMDAQLERLIEIAELPNTLLQIAPYEIGERRTFDLPVNLLTLPDRSVICYAESQTQGHLDRESTSVLPVLTAYHQLQAEALSQKASMAMIRQLRKGPS